MSSCVLASGEENKLEWLQSNCTLLPTEASLRGLLGNDSVITNSFTQNPNGAVQRMQGSIFGGKAPVQLFKPATCHNVFVKQDAVSNAWGNTAGSASAKDIGQSDLGIRKIMSS